MGWSLPNVPSKVFVSNGDNTYQTWKKVVFRSKWLSHLKIEKKMDHPVTKGKEKHLSFFSLIFVNTMRPFTGAKGNQSEKSTIITMTSTSSPRSFSWPYQIQATTSPQHPHHRPLAQSLSLPNSSPPSSLPIVFTPPS